MNPKHLIYILSLLVIASCGTSSNFQKKKFLKLKPLESTKQDNEAEQAKSEEQTVYYETEYAEVELEEEPHNLSESPNYELNENQEEFADFNEGKTLIEERKHPKKTKFKHQELMEPLEATHMEEQKKGIIFISIAAGFFVIGNIMLSLIAFGTISSLLGGIIIGICIAALIVFGILAIINGNRALKGKKENAWHWIARIAALSGGIIALVGAGGLLVNLLFVLFF